MSTNRQRFIESYARRLKTHWAANSGLYLGPESCTERAEKIADALSAGTTFDLSNPTRVTLKELGAEPTLQGAKDYLTTEDSQMTHFAEWCQ